MSHEDSNIENFLNSITPIVEKHYLQENSIKYFNDLCIPSEEELVEYFSLADLWNKFGEWSAYGVGAKIKVNDQETVIQYYAPYLSAIQIYVTNTHLTSYSDELKKDENGKKKAWTRGAVSSYVGPKEEKCHNTSENRFGHLYFQFFEQDSPYERVPMMDKINEFTEDFPGLVTLKSIDLSSASWLSVAWYPIYHIPAGRTIKDLSACFLTYHNLSSFLSLEAKDELKISRRKENKSEFTLPPFGLATYKMHGSVWATNNLAKDREKMTSLLNAADSWLKKLRVQQHDFNFFTSRSYR